MIDLNDLAYKMRNVAHARKMNGAKIDDDTFMMLKHCATEVIEAQEAFDRLNFTKEILNIDKKHNKDCEEWQCKFESELADIVACILIICANEPTIDIEKALQKCFEKNLARAEGRGDKK